jgi:hypothetical protein
MCIYAFTLSTGNVACACIIYLMPIVIASSVVQDAEAVTCIPCRAHLGGLAGGAASMYLFGPRLIYGRGGYVEDRPLLPIFKNMP